MLALALPALAQDGAKREVAGTTGVAEATAVDVSKLPIDLSRIRRQLVRVTVREERDGLTLRYMVDVFAPAPSINLFSASRDIPNYWTQPAPWGAPTHSDMLYMMTPPQHRARGANLGSLFNWLSDKTGGEKKPKK